MDLSCLLFGFEPSIMLKFHTVHETYYCSCLGHFCVDSEGFTKESLRPQGKCKAALSTLGKEQGIPSESTEKALDYYNSMSDVQYRT